MEAKEKIEKVIQDSNLSETDRAFWNDLLEKSPESFVLSVSEVVEEFPEELFWFTEILKKKQAAFSIFETDKETGIELLKDIYKEEKIKLEELADKKN